MKIQSKVFLCLVLFSLVFVAGCMESKPDAQVEYDKCTAVCAAVVDGSTSEDALTTLEICRQECKKQFLG